MYKEIEINDSVLYETGTSQNEPQGDMTLEEAYDFVMDRVRAIYDMKDAI
ncbi:MAG: hypothetical protein J5905_00050 [Prevotella sp.]|jgi:hypothetical protein|nr:hypothetical protein [Prevotella sp.]